MLLGTDLIVAVPIGSCQEERPIGFVFAQIVGPANGCYWRNSISKQNGKMGKAAFRRESQENRVIHGALTKAVLK